MASLDTAEKRAMYEGYYREENQRSVTQKSEDVALRLEFPDTDRTVARVMERCRFVLGSRPHRNGIPRVLGQVVELESREGAETWVIGPRLIAAWEAQDRATGVPKYGPLKFYRDGHWRKYA